MEPLLVSILSSAPHAHHVGRGSNLRHCTLFYLGRCEKRGGEGVQSVSKEQKAKRGKATSGEVRRREGRRRRRRRKMKKRESNERWERVCKEKRKTLSKSWSCFRRRLVVVVGEGGCGAAAVATEAFRMGRRSPLRG